MLTDSFGRKLDYLRISVTDRCNLRCCYCMPPEGVKWKPHKEIFTYEEIIRTVKILADLGVRKVRITGGEPLSRKGLPAFIMTLKKIRNIESVALTTNGILLDKYLDESETLGPNSMPNGINISIDALDINKYKQITRSENVNPKNIISLIDRLLDKNITVKINCVPIRSLNEKEIIPLAELAKDKKISVRFIELMAFGSAAKYDCIPGNEVASIIQEKFGTLMPCNESGITGSGPAIYYGIHGFAGKIGFINAVTHGFCETCNRLRLTSEGFLKLCLSGDIGLDLKTPIRCGTEDNGIMRMITEAVLKKPGFHTLSAVYGAVEEHASGMSDIGG